MPTPAFRLSALLALAFGCGNPPVVTRPEPLRVAAASDLQDALPVVVRGFMAENPGVEVETVFGSSGKLARQIEAGAPFDVFLSANESFVTELARKRLVETASVRPYAVGALVMVVRDGSDLAVGSLADLTGPGVKTVAIANPDFAPYGVAAKQALEAAGVWAALGPKLVPAESVRQAFQFVQTGNADVALVGRSLSAGGSLRRVEIDPGSYAPIVQGLGVVSASRRAETAGAFARFLVGSSGRSLLASFGFRLPPPTGAPPP